MLGVASPEVAKLRAWLSSHGFTQPGTNQPEPDAGKQELWARSDCDVRLLQRRKGVRVEVRRRGSATGWLDLDEWVALHGGLSATATVSPIELATSPPPGGQADRFPRGGFRGTPGVWLYRRSKGWAYGVKVALQMAVGVGAVGDLGWHVAYAVWHHQDGAAFTPLASGSVQIIAGALAVAAGVELAIRSTRLAQMRRLTRSCSDCRRASCSWSHVMTVDCRSPRSSWLCYWGCWPWGRCF
jgi:hypothetical protein